MASTASTSMFLPGMQTRCVTKAMPFQFIDGNILKSCRTGLTNHTRPISHHIMQLVINTLKGGHTDTHTHTDAQTKMISRNQACVTFGLTPGLKIFRISILSDKLAFALSML